MRRGFTTVELAICLSISAMVVPLCYLFVNTLTARNDRALWQLEAASSVRTLNEQLELDRARPECAARYRLDGENVVRAATPACGGELVLARHVARFERGPDGVTLTFALRESELLTHTFDVFLPGGVP